MTRVVNTSQKSFVSKIKLKHYVILAILGYIFIYQMDMFKIFNLYGDSTVSDFKEVKTEEAVEWMQHMCRDGVCLDKIDWRCGFTVQWQINEIQDCFHELVFKVEDETELDVLRKYCGKKHAQFSGLRESKSECESLGGRWGVLSSPPSLYYH